MKQNQYFNLKMFIYSTNCILFILETFNLSIKIEIEKSTFQYRKPPKNVLWTFGRGPSSLGARRVTNILPDNGKRYRTASATRYPTHGKLAETRRTRWSSCGAVSLQERHRTRVLRAGTRCPCVCVCLGECAHGTRKGGH